MKDFIKIPTNPKDLHSLTDLKNAYVASKKFQDNLQDYFMSIFDSHFKTYTELLSEIPQKKWKDYKLLDFYSDQHTEEFKKELDEFENSTTETTRVRYTKPKPNFKKLTLQEYHDFIDSGKEAETIEEKIRIPINAKEVGGKFGFFIDHKTKEIKKYHQFYTGNYNTTMVNDPIFSFNGNFTIVEMRSDEVWRSGTWRRPGDAENTTSTHYYFDVNTNTFLSKLNKN